RRTAVVAAGASHAVAVEGIAGAYFTLFRATPVAGRLFDGDETTNIAVISDRFRARTYDASADVIGQSIVVAGRRLTIVGVVGTPVRPGRGADVWVPSHVFPIDRIFGQLRKDVSLEEASSEVAGRYGQFRPYGQPRRLFVREGLIAPPGPRGLDQLVWLFTLALVTSLT